jgi:hypothetical protein
MLRMSDEAIVDGYNSQVETHGLFVAAVLMAQFDVFQNPKAGISSSIIAALDLLITGI